MAISEQTSPATTVSSVVLSFLMLMKIERMRKGIAGISAEISMLVNVSPAGAARRSAEGIHMHTNGLAGTRSQEVISSFLIGSIVFPSPNSIIEPTWRRG